MAISRYDKVSDSQIIDTYVPPPFKEMQESLNRKQLDYDTQQQKLSESDKIINDVLPKVSQVFYDSKGRPVKNPYSDIIQETSNYLTQKKNEIFEKYKNDLTSPEAKREIQNYASTVASRYNELAPNALRTEETYKEARKRLDERKGEEGGYRLLDFDNSLYNLAEGRSSTLSPSNVTDEHKFEELDKNFLEGFKADVTDRVGTLIDKGSLLKKDWGKKVEELTEQEIENKYKSFYNTNHLDKVSKSADYEIEHIYRNFKSKDPSLTREEFNKMELGLSDGSKVTPDKYKKMMVEDDLSRRIEQAKRYAFKKQDNTQNSSFLPGIDYDESGNVKTAPLPQTYESSGTITNNAIDFSNITDEKKFLNTNSKFPIAGNKTTAKGNYVVNGDYLDKLQKDFESNTGKKPYTIFGGYTDEYIKFINNKGINIDNKKDIGSSFYYKDTDSINKELTKQKEVFKALQNVSNENSKKVLISNIPQFAGVYNLLALKGINNPTKEQLEETYNSIAPSSINGVEIALSTEEMDNTINLINSNLRHYKVYNKQGGFDEGTTINTIPVTYEGTTKTLGEWIGKGGTTFQKLVDSGAISISKEIDNPNSVGGETIKTADKDGNLIEYQTGGINNAQREFFKNNNAYHSNINDTKNYYTLTKKEQKGGTIGSSNKIVKSDPLILSYVDANIPEMASEISKGYYETKTKTKTTTDSRGVLNTIDVISIYDSTSGKFIGDIDKEDFMNFRRTQYNKGLIGQKK